MRRWVSAVVACLLLMLSPAAAHASVELVVALGADDQVDELSIVPASPESSDEVRLYLSRWNYGGAASGTAILSAELREGSFDLESRTSARLARHCRMGRYFHSRLRTPRMLQCRVAFRDSGINFVTANGGAGRDLICVVRSGAVSFELSLQADGGPGADTITGGQGSDELVGGDGQDVILGREGGDDLLGHLASGGSGVAPSLDGDYLAGGAGADRIWGGPGADHLIGGTGADRLICGSDMLVAFGCGDPYGRDKQNIIYASEPFDRDLETGFQLAGNPPEQDTVDCGGALVNQRLRFDPGVDILKRCPQPGADPSMLVQEQVPHVLPVDWSPRRCTAG